MRSYIPNQGDCSTATEGLLGRDHLTIGRKLKLLKFDADEDSSLCPAWKEMNA